MATSQTIMPSQTMTNVTSMYRATARTPRIISTVNNAVSTVAMIIISPLLGAVSAVECQPATYAAAGPIVPSM